jgi:indole-3-glycerol phosphate synthase
MHTLLEKILKEKQKEVEALGKKGIVLLEEELESAPRDFKKAIQQPGKVSLIAEIKCASPSAGVIREGVDPQAVGRLYQEAGARAVSLITDRAFFNSDPAQLPLLKKAISLPVLRKDFILNEIQIRESRKLGADAVLLITRILELRQLAGLLEHSRRLGMAALVEVHNKEDLHKALASGAEIIGINNRDLDTFRVDLQTTLDLIPHIPPGIITVSESGIRDEADMRLMHSAGIQAVLVGTTLMKSPNILEKTRELVEAGKGETEGLNDEGENLRHNQL